MYYKNLKEFQTGWLYARNYVNNKQRHINKLLTNDISAA